MVESMISLRRGGAVQVSTVRRSRCGQANGARRQGVCVAPVADVELDASTKRLEKWIASGKCRAAAQNSVSFFINSYFSTGRFIIMNDLRAYVGSKKHHHTRGELRSVRRGSWSRVPKEFILTQTNVAGIVI